MQAHWESDTLLGWRNEDLTDLSLIHGYADFLLTGKLGTLTDEQRQAVETVQRRCVQSIERWQDRDVSVPPVHIRSVSLAEVIGLVLDDLHRHGLVDRDRVEVSPLRDLPTIASGLALIVSVASVVADIWPPFPETTLEASLDTQGNVAVHIRITIGAGQSVAELMSTLSGPGSHLHMASILVEQHGGQIRTSISDECAELQFTLPGSSEGATDAVEK